MPEKRASLSEAGAQLRDGYESLKNRDLRQVGLIAFVVGVLLHACVIYAVVSSGGSSDTTSPSAGPGVKITPIAQQKVTPTRLPDRTNCEQIRGTDYRSDTEQAWFRQNCAGGGG